MFLVTWMRSVKVILLIQRRVRAAFGHEVVWKTFFRHPITEHVYRSLTIPIADAIYTRVNADQVTAR